MRIATPLAAALFVTTLAVATANAAVIVGDSGIHATNNSSDSVSGSIDGGVGSNANRGILIGVHLADNDNANEENGVVTLTLDGSDITGNLVGSIETTRGDFKDTNTLVYFIPNPANGSQTVAGTFSTSWDTSISYLVLDNIVTTTPTLTDTAFNNSSAAITLQNTLPSGPGLYAAFGTSRTGSFGTDTVFELDTVEVPNVEFANPGGLIGGAIGNYALLTGPGDLDVTLTSGGFQSSGFGVFVAEIPEPASLALMGLGSVVMLRRRK